jgi:hypothetical protein
MSAPSTYTLKQLRFTFTLGTNAKFQGPNNTLVITGLRATADIVFPGPPSFPTANVRIWGMKPSDMQALTGLTFQTLAYKRNSIMIEANSGQGWTTVFLGQIITGVPDFDQAPDVYFDIQAQTLGYDLLNPATPTSFPGPASFSQVLRTIVLKMSQDFDDGGVQGSFAGPTYFAGTPAQQLRTACRKAGLVYYADLPGAAGAASLGVVEVGEPGVARNVPRWILTPQTGLVGYPKLTSVNLITVRAIFNPALRFGAPLRIQKSDQRAANGDWVIYDCAHQLSSLLPDGPWFTNMTAQPPAIFSGPNAR